MTKYAIAMGSNLGDRLGHLRSAVESMTDLGTVTGIAPMYQTAPVGGPEQDDYFNSVLVLETDLSPLDLLAGLQEIESSRSRESAVRWGPRTLDLDIVATSDGPIDSPPVLIVPHPRAALRRFVLAPLIDIWPTAIVGPGLTAAEAESDVFDQEIRLILTEWAGSSGE